MYKPLPYLQVTNAATGMWIREYTFLEGTDAQVEHLTRMRADLYKRMDQLSVHSWREFHAWRLQ